MKKAYIKAFGLGFAALMATGGSVILAATTEEIGGETIPGHVNTEIDNLFSYHKRNDASVIEAKNRVVRNLRDTNCTGCRFLRTTIDLDNPWYRNGQADIRVCTKAAIKLMIKKEIINQIKADAWNCAVANQSVDSQTASTIAEQIGKEAQSLLNSNAKGSGILDEFIGQALANKVSRYHNGMQRSSRQRAKKQNEQKIKEFANHYFHGSNEIGNINAIINKAQERAGSRSLDDAQLNNIFLDAFQEFTVTTTRNKSKSAYTAMRTDLIVDKMIQQVSRRTDRLRKNQNIFSDKTQGNLKDYLGQKLEGEIKSINRDLGR